MVSTHEHDEVIVLRRLGPGDAEKYRAILEQLTQEDRYFRFFRHVSVYAGEFVDRFVESRDDVVGVIAERGGRPLGAAHAFFESDGVAELSVVVSPEAQGHGIGKLLMARLIAALAAAGCETLVARSLADNRKFASLARSVGMRAVGHETGVTLWSRPIGTYERRRAAARARAAAPVSPQTFSMETGRP